jgi:hypothetical protein
MGVGGGVRSVFRKVSGFGGTKSRFPQCHAHRSADSELSALTQYRCFRDAAIGRKEYVPPMWHHVAPRPYRATSGATESATFIRGITTCDDVPWLWQRLLICWLKVRFLPGSPILGIRPELARPQVISRTGFGLRPRLNRLDSFRAHHQLPDNQQLLNH